MNNKIITDLMHREEPTLVLALCTQEELAQLQSLGLPVAAEDTFLSMQHMKAAQASLSEAKLQVLAVTPNAELTTEAERGLIYAMLVRCRKVISCRDKLEDMLKFDDRQGWYNYKAAYEEKVLDIYKATWRDINVYPYNIVDNIKAYNKEESYILKALYQHLSERKPGQINPGDAEMTNALRKMFSDISLSAMQPDVVLVGAIDAVPELAKAAECYAETAKIVKLHA